MQTEPLSIVAIGAHLDDCWLGMGGVALKAARRGHRVTLIQAVSTYGAWPVVAGREAEIKPVLQRIAADAGVSLIPLGYDYMRLENNPELVGHLARTLADLRPDVVFCHWEDDSNQDHAALGTASRVAAMHGACFLPPDAASPKWPMEVLHYRTDSQTRNFVPDTFVDVSGEIYDLLVLCRAFDEIYAKGSSVPIDKFALTDRMAGNRSVPLTHHTAQKFATCLTDGCACHARFAEGFRTYSRRMVGEQLLARL